MGEDVPVYRGNGISNIEPSTASEVPGVASVVSVEGDVNDTESAELSTGSRGTPLAKAGETRAWATAPGVVIENVRLPQRQVPVSLEGVSDVGSMDEFHGDESSDSLRLVELALSPSESLGAAVVKEGLEKKSGDVDLDEVPDTPLETEAAKSVMSLSLREATERETRRESDETCLSKE